MKRSIIILTITFLCILKLSAQWSETWEDDQPGWYIDPTTGNSLSMSFLDPPTNGWPIGYVIYSTDQGTNTYAGPILVTNMIQQLQTGGSTGQVFKSTGTGTGYWDDDSTIETDTIAIVMSRGATASTSLDMDNHTVSNATFIGDGRGITNLTDGAYTETDPVFIDALSAGLDVSVITNLFSSGPLVPDYFTLTSSTFTATSDAGLSSASTVTNEDRIEAIFTNFVHKSLQLIPELLYDSNSTYTITTSSTNTTIDESRLQVGFEDTNSVDVMVTHGDYSRDLTYAPSAVGEYTNRCIYTGITGSLRAATTDGLDDALTGSTNVAVYSAQDHSAGTYTRNTNCWAYGLLDMSCASPWNDTYGTFRAGTLITPQHIIYAKHYPMATGTVLRFVSSSNVVYSRSITDYRYPYEDIAVAKLSAELPSDIIPAKLFSYDDFYDYLPYFDQVDARLSGVSFQIPVVYLDHTESAYCGEWFGPQFWASVWISACLTNRAAMYKVPIGGDSGNPILCKVGTNTAIITCWYTASTGPGYTLNAASINAALLSMGGAYSNVTYINYEEYLQVATNGPPSPD